MIQWLLALDRFLRIQIRFSDDYDGTVCPDDLPLLTGLAGKAGFSFPNIRSRVASRYGSYSKLCLLARRSAD